jgi:uncharacterized Tic20 family protein
MSESYGGSLPAKPDPGPLTSDDRTMALLAHLSPLLLGFVGPLVIWLIYKEKSHFVADQAKEALNFQLAVMIVVFGLSATCIGAPIAICVVVAAVVYEIIAGLEANKGVVYRYPYTFRLIS